MTKVSDFPVLAEDAIDPTTAIYIIDGGASFQTPVDTIASYVVNGLTVVGVGAFVRLDADGYLPALDARNLVNVPGGGGGGGGGDGDVVGPSSVTDGHAVIFSGTTGKAIVSAGAAPVLEGDTRLTNARTPTTHTHAIADVTGLQAALDSGAVSDGSITTAKLADDAVTSDKVADAALSIAKTSGLQTALDLKLATADLAAEVQAAAGDPAAEAIMTTAPAGLGTIGLNAYVTATPWDILSGAESIEIPANVLLDMRDFDNADNEVTATDSSGTDVVSLALATAAAPNRGLCFRADIAQPVELNFAIPDSAVKGILGGFVRLDNTTATIRAVTLGADSAEQAWQLDSEALAEVPASGKLLLAWARCPGLGTAGADLFLYSFVTATA